MQDVSMYWRGDIDAVQGVNDVQLPQFTIIRYNVSVKVESLATGK